MDSQSQRFTPSPKLMDQRSPLGIQASNSTHATLEESRVFVHDILDLYAQTYQDLLAVPVVKGRKSEDERFAGAYNTTTVELYVPVSGRGIQGATSHMLG